MARALVLRGRDAPFIRHDLEEMYLRDRARGMSASRASWRYTRLALASSASLLNATRRNMRNAFMLDLRQAVRTLARDRGFTAVSLGTLGAGLALCVIVAVLVNAYLVRGLPYPESHRLFDVRYGAAERTRSPAGWRSWTGERSTTSWSCRLRGTSTSSRCAAASIPRCCRARG